MFLEPVAAGSATRTVGIWFIIYVGLLASGRCNWHVTVFTSAAEDLPPAFTIRDKDHGLISDWAQRRPVPSEGELKQRLPGNDGAMHIKLPVLKLLEAIDGQLLLAWQRMLHSCCNHNILTQGTDIAHAYA